MKMIKETLRRHGLSYTLIQRNIFVALFGVSGTFTDKILHYEVVFIRIRNDKYGHREVIPSDEEFGRTKPDRHFQNIDDALLYFAEWTARLMQGVEGKDKKVIPFHPDKTTSILHKIRPSAIAEFAD